MTKELRQKIIKALGLVQEATQYSNPFAPGQLFGISEELIAFQAYLLGHMMTAETIYRRKVVEYQNQEKSVSRAESEAKATSEYQDYQYIKHVYELLGEQVKLVKKFMTSLEKEYETTR